VATVDVITNRSTASEILGKAYFETDTNSFIVYNGIGWVELESDGTGAAAPYSEYSAYFANDFLDVGDISGLVGGKSALTLSFWLKIVSVAHGGFIGNNAAWSTGYRGAVGWHGGNIDLGYWDDSGSNLSFRHTTDDNYNDWNHFAFVQDGTSFVAYRNGSSVASATVGATTSTSLWNNFAIGRERSQYFTGYIDDVAIIDGALNATQVGALQTDGLPQNPGATLGHWRMGDDSNDSPTDGSSISSTQDSSVNGNHATQSTTSRQPTFSTEVPA
jgi:hypothetical protein